MSREFCSYSISPPLCYEVVGSCQCHQAGNRHQHDGTKMLNPSIQVLAWQPGEAPHPAPPDHRNSLDCHGTAGTRRDGVLLCSNCGDQVQDYPTGTPGQHQAQLHTLLFFLHSWFPFLAPLYLCTSTPVSSQIKSLAPVTISPFVPVLLHMRWILLFLILDS